MTSELQDRIYRLARHACEIASSLGQLFVVHFGTTSVHVSSHRLAFVRYGGEDYDLVVGAGLDAPVDELPSHVQQAALNGLASIGRQQVTAAIQALQEADELARDAANFVEEYFA